MRSAAATLSGVSLIVSALVPGDGRDAPRAQHDAQQVDRLLEVGVREEQRLHHLLLELAALGRRVGHHVQHLRVHHAVEGVPGRRERGERLVEADVLQVERHGRVLERRVEGHVDRRGARRAPGTPRAGSRRGTRARAAAARRRRARGPAARARGRAPCSSSSEARPRSRIASASFISSAMPERAGAELEREAVLGERLVVLAAARPAAARGWCGRSRPACARARARAGSRRCPASACERPLVLEHGPVVVLQPLGVLAGAEGGRGGAAAARRERERQQQRASSADHLDALRHLEAEQRGPRGRCSRARPRSGSACGCPARPRAGSRGCGRAARRPRAPARRRPAAGAARAAACSTPSSSGSSSEASNSSSSPPLPESRRAASECRGVLLAHHDLPVGRHVEVEGAAVESRRAWSRGPCTPSACGRGA